MAGDLLSLDASSQTSPAGGGEPLIHPVMKAGRRLAPSPPLDEIRQRAKRELEHLPDALRRLTPGATLAVEVADDLVKLAAAVDTRLQKQAPSAKP